MSGDVTAGHRSPRRYEIRLEGHLGPRWAAWFDGLSLTNEGGGITLIRGEVVDEAALHGLLQKVRDTGLPLVSVTQIDPDVPDDPYEPDGHTPRSRQRHNRSQP